MRPFPDVASSTEAEEAFLRRVVLTGVAGVVPAGSAGLCENLLRAEVKEPGEGTW
ncbi:hypothetical protein [Streptomyces ipomoeae]|uniref:hypothetical protein n=1 Tax=Streptomyces ipomoeae TaxID=103232 RepID=UPI0015EFF371|nr:hypothetical protein [Streptomyces ipomoeae]MDX2935208.1 hypothetical protein [Streptomyces ipomoeae]